MNSKELQTPFWLKAATPLDAKYGPYATIAERDAIPMEDRYQGMSVFVLDRGDGLADYYRLMQGITNNDWVSFSATYKASIENHYGDMQAMYDDQTNQSLQMIEYVADASADNIPGYAFYEYLGTSTGSRADYRLVSSVSSESPFVGYEIIFWVSPTGNDSTAEPGNRNKPWADPATAAQEAYQYMVMHTVTPLIYIAKGTYQVSAPITQALVDVYCEYGVLVWRDTTNTGSSWVIGGTIGARFRVFGHGRFFVNYYTLYDVRVPVYFNGAEGQDVYIEAQDIGAIQLEGGSGRVIIEHANIFSEAHNGYNVIYRNCTFNAFLDLGYYTKSDRPINMLLDNCILNLDETLMPDTYDIEDNDGNIALTVDQSNVAYAASNWQDITGLTQQDIANLRYQTDGSSLMRGTAVVHLAQNVYSNWGAHLNNFRVKLTKCDLVINRPLCFGIKGMQEYTTKDQILELDQCRVINKVGDGALYTLSKRKTLDDAVGLGADGQRPWNFNRLGLVHDCSVVEVETTDTELEPFNWFREGNLVPEDLVEPYTWYVSILVGDDENGNGSAQLPFKTIQKAHDMAESGDVIHLLHGQSHDKYGDINISKNITLYSENIGIRITNVNLPSSGTYDIILERLYVDYISPSDCIIKLNNTRVIQPISQLKSLYIKTVSVGDEVILESATLEDFTVSGALDIIITGNPLVVSNYLHIVNSRITGDIDYQGTTFDAEITNSILDGNLTVADNLLQQNSVITGTATVIGTHTIQNQNAFPEVRQTLLIDDTNATDAIVLDGAANIIQIQLDAAMTVDWKPAGITGWKQGRAYMFEIIKNADIGVDMSDARAAGNVGYDDDIDPFPPLSYITTTQKRAVIMAYGLKTTFGQFGRLIMTDSTYVE